MGYLDQHSEAWNAISLSCRWEDSTVYLRHYSSDAQATFYLRSAILPGLFERDEGSWTRRRYGWLALYVHSHTGEKGPVMDEVLFSEKL